jgi:putative transposase
MENQLRTAKEIAKHTGTTSRWINEKAREEGWLFSEETVRGGRRKKYFFNNLPPEIQKALTGSNGDGTSMPQASTAMTLIAQPLPFAQFSSLHNGDLKLSPDKNLIWTPETAISPKDLKNPRFLKRLEILKKVDQPPPGWTKSRSAWIEALAKEHKEERASLATIRRWLKKRKEGNIAALRHGNSCQVNLKRWDPENLDLLKGIYLKPENRFFKIKDLFERFEKEAKEKGWKIGGYRSALFHLNKIPKPLKAFSRGGMRGLDNELPSILRDYSDLSPLEIIVGDQHRCDFWIQNAETGKIFRPEVYLWQDLFSRLIFGAAFGEDYDAWMMAVGLHMGLKKIGLFGSVYLDHGKAEQGRLMTEIQAASKALGMNWGWTTDFPMDLRDMDGEDLIPHVRIPGTRINAIPKNARSKMIERTFRTIEEIMGSHYGLAGKTKRLSDAVYNQELDSKEVEALAKAGKLLTEYEFLSYLFKAINFYNFERPHRGLLREWRWKEKPLSITPSDYFKAYEAREGWHPQKIDPRIVDLIFLPRETRIIHSGRIEFRNDFYEDEDKEGKLTRKEGRVDIRFNPQNLTEIFIFQNGEFICRAIPVERSSMKNLSLAKRKIRENRAMKKPFIEEFRRLTSGVSDYRQYSQVPALDRAVAIIGKNRRQRAEQNAELYRPRTEEAMAAEIRQIEGKKPSAPEITKPLPKRPKFSDPPIDQYAWLLEYQRWGAVLEPADMEFLRNYEKDMKPDEVEMWAVKRELDERCLNTREEHP